MDSKDRHPQMARIYAAATAALKLPAEISQSHLGRLINVGAQVINNWEHPERGPSKAGLLQFQSGAGINASWVESGLGPMFIEGAVCTSPLLVQRASTAARPTVLHLGENTARYSSWPFSDQLRAALQQLTLEGLAHVENVIRAHLKMAPIDEPANRRRLQQ